MLLILLTLLKEERHFEHFILWKKTSWLRQNRDIPELQTSLMSSRQCVFYSAGRCRGVFFPTWDASKTHAFVRLMVRWHLEFCKKPICSGDRASACAVSARLPNRLGSSCKRLISFFLPCRSWVPVTHTAFILSHLTHTPALIRAAVTNRLTHTHKPKKKQARHK